MTQPYLEQISINKKLHIVLILKSKKSKQQQQQKHSIQPHHNSNIL